MILIGILIGFVLSAIAHYLYMSQFRKRLNCDMNAKHGIIVLKTTTGQVECDVAFVAKMSSGKIKIKVLKIRTDVLSINNDKKAFINNIPTVVEENKIDWIDETDRKTMIDQILKDLK